MRSTVKLFPLFVFVIFFACSKHHHDKPDQPKTDDQKPLEIAETDLFAISCDGYSSFNFNEVEKDSYEYESDKGKVSSMNCDIHKYKEDISVYCTDPDNEFAFRFEELGFEYPFRGQNGRLKKGHEIFVQTSKHKPGFGGASFDTKECRVSNYHESELPKQYQPDEKYEDSAISCAGAHGNNFYVEFFKNQAGSYTQYLSIDDPDIDEQGALPTYFIADLECRVEVDTIEKYHYVCSNRENKISYTVTYVPKSEEHWSDYFLFEYVGTDSTTYTRDNSNGKGCSVPKDAKVLENSR